MKRKDLEQLANFLGYDFRELVDDWRYKGRKGKVYEIVASIDKKVSAVYSTLTQIESFLRQYTP